MKFFRDQCVFNRKKIPKRFSFFAKTNFLWQSFLLISAHIYTSQKSWKETWYIWDKVFKSGLSKFFKGCLRQNLRSPLFNTLSYMYISPHQNKKASSPFYYKKYFWRRFGVLVVKCLTFISFIKNIFYDKMD